MQRPTHPDFEAICKMVCDLDDEATNQDTFEGIVESEIDAHTLAYLADQRALRAMMVAMAVGTDPMTGVGSTWIDGFFVGLKWARRDQCKT